MRACVQCGLSIGETASFCAVCGARFEPAAEMPAMTETSAPPETEPVVAEPRVEEPGPEAAEAAEAAEAGDDPVERKVAEVAALLDDAAGCEDADVARAAALYQEAIVGCLEAADDPLGCAGVRGELLRGFDGLSSLLERQGLAEESLAVVDDAAALGLLNGGEDARSASREALLERRESLRHALFVDSARL